MKKCASCSKDLPDAALHCVFCGAKQPPAAAPVSAKTVMGYSANEVIEQLKAQGVAVPQRPAQPAPAPPITVQGPAPVPQQPQTFVPPAQPRPQTPTPAPPVAYQPPVAPQPAPLAPAAAASAKTMFVDQGPPPVSLPQPQQPASPMANVQTLAQGNVSPFAPPSAQGGYSPQPFSPPASAFQPPPAQPYNPPIAPPYTPPAPAAAIPAYTPPYLASQSRGARPIEPWKDSLRLMMFVWGALLLAAFATPLTTDPMTFNWDLILHGTGLMKVLPLTMAAIGLLSIVFASIPLATSARGLLAGVLGLAGIVVPIALVAAAGATPEWHALATTIGMVILLPGLFARHEYKDAALPRILVTIGALLALLPFLVPEHGIIPIVALFQALIDVPGSLKIQFALFAGYVVLLLLTLLCWLPAPSTGGAKVLAWLLLLWGLVVTLAILLLAGHIGDSVKAAPYTVVASWIASGAGAGKGGGLVLGIGVAYGVLVGYGFATVIGKKLE